MQEETGKESRDGNYGAGYEDEPSGKVRRVIRYSGGGGE